MYKINMNSLHSALTLIVVEVAILGFTLVASIALGLFGTQINEVDNYFILLFVTQLSVLASAFAGVALAKRDVPASLMDFAPQKVDLKQVGRLVLATVGLLLFSLPWTMLFTNLLIELGLTLPATPVTFTTPYEFLMGVALVCILPAISEEFAVRGTIMNGLVRLGVMPAIFLSAFIFAIMHGNPFQLVHQFFLGLVLAYVVILSKNLTSSTIMHFTNNFLALVLSAVSTLVLETASTGSDVTTQMTWVEIMVLVVMSAGGLALFVPTIKAWTRQTILNEVEKQPYKRATYMRWRDAGGLFKYVSRLGEWTTDTAGQKERVSPVMILAIALTLFILALNTFSLVIM